MGFLKKDTSGYMELFKKITSFDRVNDTKNLQEFIFNKAKSYNYAVMVDESENIICKSKLTHKVLIQVNYDIAKHLGYKNPPTIKEQDNKIISTKGYLGASSMSVAILLHLLSKNIPISAVFTANKYNNMQGARGLKIQDDIKYFLNLNYHQNEPFIDSCSGLSLVYATTVIDKIEAQNKKSFLTTSMDEFVSKNTGESVSTMNKNPISILFDSVKNVKNINIIDIHTSNSINFTPSNMKMIYTIKGDVPINIENFNDKELPSNNEDAMENTPEIIKFISSNLDKITKFDKTKNIPSSSRSIASIGIKEDKLEVVLNIRYDRDIENETLIRELELSSSMYNFSLKKENISYPWLVKENNFAKIVKQEVGKFYLESENTTYHGDSECSIIAYKNKNLNICSIGPIIKDENTLIESLNKEDIQNLINAIINITTQAVAL